MSSAGRIGAQRTVTWSTSATIAVGHHRCGGCDAETPEPSESVLVEHAKISEGDRYIWPDDDWMPMGWTVIGSEDTRKILCPTCTAAVAAALARRRRSGGP